MPATRSAGSRSSSCSSRRASRQRASASTAVAEVEFGARGTVSAGAWPFVWAQSRNPRSSERADGDQERPQVRERRGLLELVERGVRERELAAGQATRDVVGGTAVKPGVDAARLLAVKERLAQPGHRLADQAVVGEQFVEAVG